MANYEQKFGGHVAHTLTAGAPITGGQVLKLAGANTVAPCTAGADYVGIAGHDAAKGQPVTVHFHTVGEVTVADAVKAGNRVKTGADGKAAKAANASDAGAFGIALTDGEPNATALIRAGI